MCLSKEFRVKVVEMKTDRCVGRTQVRGILLRVLLFQASHNCLCMYETRLWPWICIHWNSVLSNSEWCLQFAVTPSTCPLTADCNWLCKPPTVPSYLVLFQAALWHGFISLLLERDDDQSHKDVDKEEGEDDEVDHVEDGGFHAVTRTGTLVFIRGINRVFQHSREPKRESQKDDW